MEKYERVGKLVPESFHYGNTVGSKSIDVFRCLICICLVDEPSLETHRNICIVGK